MVLTVPTDTARPALVAGVEAFLAAVDGLDEPDLLGASRCHGWARLDVVVHVLGGWHELLAGLVSPVDDAPTVDAATYWTAFAAATADDDPVAEITAQRRRSSAYGRPSAAVAQLHDVGAALLRGVASAPDGPRLWQGQVLRLGDLLATWAVEHAVHQLDLLVGRPVPAGALALGRATVEALVGGPVPGDDVTVLLQGAGRLPADADGPLAGRRPVLG